MRNLLSLSSLVLVACGTEPSAPAGFEAATDEQLQRTITAALSFDTVLVAFIASGYASAPDSEDACPRISTDGARRHVVGGCTNDEGERIEGEVFLDNVPGLLGGGDSSKPSALEAVGLVLAESGGGPPLRVDGTMSWITGGASDAAIDVELGGINVRSETRFSCPDNLCTYEAGTIDVAGLGSATLSGSFGDTVAVEVAGADTLVIGSDGDCLTYEVGGRSGLVCNP